MCAATQTAIKPIEGAHIDRVRRFVSRFSSRCLHLQSRRRSPGYFVGNLLAPRRRPGVATAHERRRRGVTRLRPTGAKFFHDRDPALTLTAVFGRHAVWPSEIVSIRRSPVSGSTYFLCEHTRRCSVHVQRVAYNFRGERVTAASELGTPQPLRSEPKNVQLGPLLGGKIYVICCRISKFGAN